MQNKLEEPNFNDLLICPNFRGRCNRCDFISVYLTHYVWCFIFSAIAYLIGFDIYDAVESYHLIVFLPMLSVFIRRMHDIGVSGWISIIPLVTIVFVVRLLLRDDLEGDMRLGVSVGCFVSSVASLLVFLIAIFKRGVVGDNIYGSDPCDKGANTPDV